MNRIARGWEQTRESWRLLRSHKSLVVFPMLSTFFSIVAVVAIVTTAVILRGDYDHLTVDHRNPVVYLVAAATAYVPTFIATFFNVAMASCAMRAMRGEDPKVRDGIADAVRRIGPIVSWTFLLTAVGVLLRLLERRLPLVGVIAVWMADAAWAIASFFVVPVIAAEGVGPLQALKRSVSVVKARWGESATGKIAISMIMVLVLIGVALFGGVSIAALARIDQPALAALVGLIMVAVLVFVVVITSSLNHIFRVAVYHFAVTGETPSGFDGQQLQHAFVARRPQSTQQSI